MALPLRAQEEGWTAFQGAWRKARHGPVNLLAPKSWLTMDLRVADEEMLRLTVTGDVWIEPLDGPGLDRLRKARGWSDASHWLLLDQNGQVLDEGTTPPTGTTLRGALLAEGAQPTWESLDRFLRLHPDNGTALERRLRFACGMARDRFRILVKQGVAQGAVVSWPSRQPSMTPARILDPGRAAGWDREVVETLDRLGRLPDAWRLNGQTLDGMLFRFWLQTYGPAASPEIRSGLTQFQASVLDAWRHRPDSAEFRLPSMKGGVGGWGFGGLWLSCDAALKGPEGFSELPSLIPSPGHPWPSWDFLVSLSSQAALSNHWPAFLALLDQVQTDPPNVGLSQESLSDWQNLKAGVAFGRVQALVALERWPEAISALQAYRRLTGKDWNSIRSSMKATYSKPIARPPEAKAGDDPGGTVPQGFLDVLDQPALDDPPAARVQQPLRFLIWGAPEWTARWPSIRATGPLATWGPQELRDEKPTASDGLRLREAGFPERGWAVFRGGSDIVARGETAPDPVTLDLQLSGVASSRIEVLDAFLAKHPDNLDAHRERYDLARARMPLAALEGRMQEDAAAAWLPLDFGPEAPWISDLEGWRTRAGKVVPPLRAALERWPDNAFLWRAWVSWSAFLPRPPSVLGLATDIPVFGSRPAWAAALPGDVHQAVARECRANRRFQDMADWFQGAWAELQSRHWRYRPDKASMDQETAIYEGYREALQGLGRTAERTDLEHAWSVRQAEYPKAAPR